MGDTVECVITGGQFDKSAEWQVIEIAWKSFYRLCKYRLYFWESRILIAIILSQLENLERLIAKQANMDVAGIIIQVNWTTRLRAAQVKTFMQNTNAKWVFTERCFCESVKECALGVLLVWQGCYLVQGGILTRLHKVARICRGMKTSYKFIYKKKINKEISLPCRQF